jgi:predicted ribosomally synthesized peptide with SipW-like signal peptide
VAKTKRLLVGILIIGALAALIGAGTFATFDATTTNSATFTSGTIVLSNTVNAGSACLSTAGAPIQGGAGTNNANGCDALFPAATNKPGDTATANITLAHTGNINASKLQLFAAGACASSAAPDANGNRGSGALCPQLQLIVKETLSDFTTSTGAGCVYGGAGCGFDAAHTPGDFGANHQLAGAYNLGAMNAATTRYFVVSVTFPLSSDNAYQGSKAALNFTWNLAQ